MPRPRKPTQLHLVTNTYNSTRHKDREREPVVTEPLGEPPRECPEITEALWYEVANMIPPGVATKADKIIVELACRLIIQMRTGRCTPALASQLRCCLASLGMTPADRSRVLTAAVEAMDDPADKYFT
jgi:hypothetical protein